MLTLPSLPLLVLIIIGVVLYCTFTGVGKKLSASNLSVRESSKIQKKKPVPDVAVRFSEDNSCYLMGEEQTPYIVVRRYSTNNTIYD